MPDPVAAVTAWRSDITTEAATAAVGLVIAAIQADCGWHIAPQTTETVVLDPPAGNWLYLPTLKLVEVTEIRLDGDTITDWSTSADGTLWRSQGWPADLGGIEADITHGHTEWPGDLTAVIAGAAVRSIDEGSREGALIVTTDTVGPHTVTYQPTQSTDPTGLTDTKSQEFATGGSPVDVVVVIDRYRLEQRSA